MFYWAFHPESEPLKEVAALGGLTTIAVPAKGEAAGGGVGNTPDPLFVKPEGDRVAVSAAPDDIFCKRGHCHRFDFVV